MNKLRLLILFTILCAASDLLGFEHPLARYAPSKDFIEKPWGLLSFDGRTKSPRWTLEKLTEESLTAKVKRDHDPFHADKEIPDIFRVSPADYVGSGQDRGHCPCARNHENNLEEFESTYAMSGMNPQFPKVNERVWAYLEEANRKMAVGDTDVYVITGPAYLSNGNGRITIKVIGGKQVWQPTHCVKSVLLDHGKGRFEKLSWIVPNIPEPNEKFDSYREPLEKAEEALGVMLWEGVK